MGGSVGPVLANIIMKECEKVIDKLYIRYVEDTLLVIRKKDIDIVVNKFSSFNKNKKFAVDPFENCVSHFLDTEFVAMDSVYFTKIPKLVNTQILNLLHCGNGKHHG